MLTIARAAHDRLGVRRSVRESSGIYLRVVTCGPTEAWITPDERVLLCAAWVVVGSCLRRGLQCGRTERK